MKRPLRALSLMLLLAGCETTVDKEDRAFTQAGRQCFFPTAVSRFTEGPGESILVHVGARDAFVLEAVAPCPDIDHSFEVGLEPRGFGALCSGDMVDLIVPTPLGEARRCLARVGRQLGEAESEAVR
ncbi:MAG: DUF6491 family protein [Sphingomonadaceae bacterium]